MAGRKTIVRWRDWDEWQEVHQGLFSSDIYERQRAVSRVAAWRARGQIPIAVNATTQFVEIQLHEEIAQHQVHAIGVSARSYMEMSLMYSSAIVRCVNGLVDGAQKGMYAMAVSQLAQRIGIPLWIVDLRHESAHNQLPSLSVLRFAAKHLLAWLRSNYWDRQDEAIRSPIRQVAQILQSKLLSDNETETSPSMDLKEVLTSDHIREIAVPLLVNGHQQGEQIYPTGALFLSNDEPSLHPKEQHLVMLLNLQMICSTICACVLALLTQKLVWLIRAPIDSFDSSVQREIEICMNWIKILVSNEWRERMRFAEEPIHAIYQSGASMLALCSCITPFSPQSKELLERLRGVLCTCKKIRNHPMISQYEAIERQLHINDKITTWASLDQWPMIPFAQKYDYQMREMMDIVEYSLEIDTDNASFTVSSAQEEDTDMEEMMKEFDAQYEQELATIFTLKQTVHDRIVHGGLHTTDQTVLPLQEVERIQSEIVLW